MHGVKVGPHQTRRYVIDLGRYATILKSRTGNALFNSVETRDVAAKHPNKLKRRRICGVELEDVKKKRLKEDGKSNQV